MERERFRNPTPRNFRWYVSELKSYADKPIDKVNLNANTWKWLGQFVVAVCSTRRINHRVSEDIGNLEIINPILKKLGVPEVCYTYAPLTGGTVYLPQKYCKAYRNAYNTLEWCLAQDFEHMKTVNAIIWCSVQKDWFHCDAFYTYYGANSAGKKVPYRSACPKLFTCSMCAERYAHDSHTIKKHPVLGLMTCLWCSTAPLKNPTPTRDSIYGNYHSHSKSFKFWPHRAPKDSSVPMGVELEMQVKNFVDYNPTSEAWALYQKQIEYNPAWNMFYFERDGSLGDAGIEMITQPMSRRLGKEFWKLMLPKIRERFNGWNTEKYAGDSQYGIHVTFAIAEWGKFNLARLIKFLETAKNQVFVQAIAQRGVLYGSERALAQRDKMLSEVVRFDKGKMGNSRSRAQAVNVKGELCEIRMFRSTLNHVSFMKNLEFLHAFREWCLSSPYSADAEVYLAWLIKDAAKLYPKYPNLYKYLCLDTFPVKFAAYTVKNKWVSQFQEVTALYQKGQKDMFAPEVKIPNEDYQTCA
jgi:hypothetical protein